MVRAVTIVRSSAVMTSVMYLMLAVSGCKNALLYYPYKHLVATPASIGLAYEDVSFNTEDGVILKGWWVPKQGARAVVLFCHGNGGNISFLLDTISIFHSLNLDVFVFDYRGYGASGGSPTEDGTYLDVRAAWNHMLAAKKAPPEKIILIGRSLGGSIAAWLARERRPRALILESTFTDAADVANFHYRIAPGRLLFGDTYNTKEYVRRVACPVLVVHSPNDEIIPYEHGKCLFQLAPSPKEFLLIRGSHNSGFVDSIKEYKAGLDNFISKYCKPGK
jgi:pimeloyl-ACP methyl ester carboxylesterase